MEDGGVERCFERQEGSPEIREVFYVGQDAQDRRVLLFRVDLQDREADLVGGTYRFWVDGTPLPSQAIPPPQDPTVLRFQAFFRLDLKGLSLSSGQMIRIEFQATDAQGHTSNQPLFVMRVVM